MVGEERGVNGGSQELAVPRPPDHGKRRIRIALGDLTAQNIGQIKQINTVVFPVTYSDKFYKDALAMGDYCKLAYCNDISVGAVCCRLDVVSKETGEIGKLYIMTLGVLAPYRGYGIGSYLLEHILYHAQLSHSAKRNGYEGANAVPVTEVLLHVQVSNTEALEWYKKRQFEVVKEVKDYYKRVTPSDAWLLRKTL